MKAKWNFHWICITMEKQPQKKICVKNTTIISGQKVSCYIQCKHINGLVQGRHNSIANALELRLSCSNLSLSKLKQIGAIAGYYHYLPGTHFVKDLWYYDTKILVAFPCKNMTWPDHNSAHAMRAVLLWHVQNVDLIGWSESKLEQEEYSNDFNYEIINHL